MLIGYVDNHGIQQRAGRRPRLGRGRPADRARPPQRRRAAPSPCTGSPPSERSAPLCAGAGPGSLDSGDGLRPRTPRRRPGCSMPSSTTSTHLVAHLDGPRLAARAVHRAGLHACCGASSASCARCSRPPPTATARVDRRAQRPDGAPPHHPADLRPRPRRPAPARRHPRRPASPSCSSARPCSAWPRWSATSGPSRLGVAPPRRCTASTSTPRPTGRAATAPSAAPRAPTSRPTAPGARGGHRLSPGGERRRPRNGSVGSAGERRPPDRPVRQDAAARDRPRARPGLPQGDRAVRRARALPRARPHLPADAARAVERPRRGPRRRAGRRHAARVQPLRRAARAARRRRRDDGPLRPAAAGEAPRPRPGAGQHRPPGARGGAARQEDRRA